MTRSEAVQKLQKMQQQDAMFSDAEWRKAVDLLLATLTPAPRLESIVIEGVPVLAEDGQAVRFPSIHEAASMVDKLASRGVKGTPLTDPRSKRGALLVSVPVYVELEDVRSMVRNIDTTSHSDPEAAAGTERRLYVDVLRAVANGQDNTRELAQAALVTQDMVEFRRG